LYTVGSVCSGIEAASVAWKPLDFSFKWFSEIADFPARVLDARHPDVPNIGDMINIPQLLRCEEIFAPDIICGGTPCQAFSLAGLKNGLVDERGNLTMSFVEIIEANDEIRAKKGLAPSIVLWENVEGVLTDKTNAFGCFVAALAGLDEIPQNLRWDGAGIIKGTKRNVAWRVLDAKYFGLPQRRRRLYLMAGGKDFSPENILFEVGAISHTDHATKALTFERDGHSFEAFREYTDCLYSAYGTKWNGNAAAYNGSLFIVQNNRIRRLSPLECERLMGFDDDYTNISGARRTNRYQALGNSWAVPVIKWIGQRLLDYPQLPVADGDANTGSKPNNSFCSDISSIICSEAPEEIYISPVGCHGIVRRKNERKLSMNPRLEEVLLSVASQMTDEETEKRSRVQKRGRFSDTAKSQGNFY